MMKTNKKGISLIVLAITIVIMIILAASIILSLSGNNLTGSAKEATSSSDVANAKHVVSVAYGEWEMGEVEGYTTFKSYAQAKLEEAGFKVSGKGGINVSENGTISIIYKDTKNKTAYIPTGYVASEAKGENTIDGGLVIYEGYEPVTDRNLSEAQITRNQYVWVPVETISSFKIKDWKIDGTSVVRMSYNMSDVSEAKKYAEMYDSVEEYKGFYIARYEAGKEGTDTLVSKKNATAWTDITWSDAKVKCETLTSDSAVSHLIYGEEWDGALTFISITNSGYPKDSSGKGEASGSVVRTGSNDAYALNNIYDMAGNVQEMTMEISKDDYDGAYYIVRGRFSKESDVGRTLPAAGIDFGVGNEKYYFQGFRAALYIK